MDRLRREKRKALSLFVTAGYPTIGTTVPLVLALAGAGADLIEIGIPFSDPIADGPTIQQSSEVALRNGITVQKALDMVQEIRTQSDVPVVLMGYANPIYAYGAAKFFSTGKKIGVDGTIIPDMPLEESDEYRTLARQHDIASVFLAAPTTTPDRLVQLDKASTGFLYCVSVTGVTGERQAVAPQTELFLKQARSCVKNNPLLVGFGISTPDDARRIASLSDGIIIGSALINVMQSAGTNDLIGRAGEFVRSMRMALDDLQ
jgi:tryptophan synthase alpha chain